MFLPFLPLYKANNKVGIIVQINGYKYSFIKIPYLTQRRKYFAIVANMKNIEEFIILFLNI